MAADHRPRRGAGAADEEGRQPAHHDPRRPADPPGQRPGRRLEPGAPDRRAQGAPVGPAEGLAVAHRDGQARRRLHDAGVRARAAAGQPPPPRRVPVQRRADRLLRRRSTCALGEWRTAFEEHHVQGSNALHARPLDGKGSYLLGPAARVTLAADQLHPLAKEALAASGLRGRSSGRTCTPRSWRARSSSSTPSPRRSTSSTPTGRRPSRSSRGQNRPGVAAWATEAPRGLLFHRYEVDEAGRVAKRPDRPADEPEPGRHRGRPASSPRRRSSRCRTTRRRSGSSR